MLFNSIEFILGINFVFFGTNHAVNHTVSGPTLLEKNCTHASFSLEVQYIEYPEYNGLIQVNVQGGDSYGNILNIFFDYTKKFGFRKQDLSPFYNYTTFRVEPIPDTWEDKFTLYSTLRFPNENDRFTLNALGYKDDFLSALISPVVGKSRCLPQNGIIGCDPYCVCDTVVQTQCEDGSLISGMCSDTSSLTDILASYQFNEACESGGYKPTSSEQSSSGTSKPFSSKKSSSGGSKPFSSTESSSGTSVTPFQFSKSTMGILAAAIFGVLAIVAIACYRKKKKGHHSTLSDEEGSN